MKNLKNAVLTPIVLTEITGKIEEIRLLIPFAVGLSASEKMSNPALGGRRTQFVQLAVESARQNPGMLPSFMDATIFEAEHELYKSLVIVQVAVQQLERMVSDTVHLAGNQVFAGAREFYNTAKRASQANVPGAMAVTASLQTRYSRSKGKKGISGTANPVALVLN